MIRRKGQSWILNIFRAVSGGAPPLRPHFFFLTLFFFLFSVLPFFLYSLCSLCSFFFFFCIDFRFSFFHSFSFSFCFFFSLSLSLLLFSGAQNLFFWPQLPSRFLDNNFKKTFSSRLGEYQFGAFFFFLLLLLFFTIVFSFLFFSC